MAQVYFENLRDFMEYCQTTRSDLTFSKLENKYESLANANPEVGDILHMLQGTVSDLHQRVMLVVRVNKNIKGGTPGALTCVSLYRRAKGDEMKKRHWDVEQVSKGKKKTLFVETREDAFSLQSRITVNLAEPWHVEGGGITICTLGRVPEKNMTKVIAKVDKFFGKSVSPKQKQKK